MRKLLIFLITIFIGLPTLALERYASRMTPDGTIYFIMPKKLSKLKGIKHFNFDMTLLSWTDSVTVNFTFESDLIGLPDKLSIRSGQNIFRCDSYSLLFQDIKKNRFEIRVTSKFSIEAIKEIIQGEEPPIFIFSQGENEESATYSGRSWIKERKTLCDILTIYQYSK